MAAIGQARPATGALPGIRMPIFILGVALALLAFLAMFAFGIVFASRSATVAQTRAVVALVEIPAREPITLDKVTVATVPAPAAPGALTHLSQADGLSALVTIHKGQTLTDNMVSSNPDLLTASGASSYLPIAQGYVAIALPTSEQQGVAGYIAQGDYINVTATMDLSTFSPLIHGSSTRTVFQGLHVIRVGPASPAAKQGQAQGSTSSLTVVMSQCEAAYMTWLIQNATLKYQLESDKDYGTPPTAPDPNCSEGQINRTIGPPEIDGRWAFTKV